MYQNSTNIFYIIPISKITFKNLCQINKQKSYEKFKKNYNTLVKVEKNTI